MLAVGIALLITGFVIKHDKLKLVGGCLILTDIILGAILIAFVSSSFR